MVDQPTWLQKFHCGDQQTLGACYEDHFHQVTRVVGKYLSGADQENVVHDVFCTLIADQNLRKSFQGGALSSWLSKIAQRRAIDYYRRQQRRTTLDLDEIAEPATPAPQKDVFAQRLIERFRQEVLPPKWQAVFEARFMSELSQREAATKLGIRRTTLAYQEARVRKLLKDFLTKAANHELL